MRRYQPIWEALKKKKTAKIQCKNQDKAKIKKAVTKEKDQDTAFKTAFGNMYMLTTTETVDGLIFRLQKRLHYIGEHDL